MSTCRAALQTGPKKVAVVGGGLAGLSVAYHLLEQCGGPAVTKKSTAAAVKITIWDRASVGDGGASAVAGGYVRKNVRCTLPSLHSVDDESYIFATLDRACTHAHDDSIYHQDHRD
jgi:glycine/D-amino acid oxidase-like deaminating enzyme